MHISPQPSNHSAMTSADSVIALMPNVLKVFIILNLPLPHPSLFSSSFSPPLLLIWILIHHHQVFLENGQTKSFKYDSSTTVQVGHLITAIH